MKKNKLWSFALAGALAVSNLSGVVAVPLTTIVAHAANGNVSVSKDGTVAYSSTPDWNDVARGETINAKYKNSEASEDPVPTGTDVVAAAATASDILVTVGTNAGADTASDLTVVVGSEVPLGPHTITLTAGNGSGTAGVITLNVVAATVSAEKTYSGIEILDPDSLTAINTLAGTLGTTLASGIEYKYYTGLTNAAKPDDKLTLKCAAGALADPSDNTFTILYKYTQSGKTYITTTEPDNMLSRTWTSSDNQALTITNPTLQNPGAVTAKKNISGVTLSVSITYKKGNDVITEKDDFTVSCVSEPSSIAISDKNNKGIVDSTIYEKGSTDTTLLINAAVDNTYSAANSDKFKPEQNITWIVGNSSYLSLSATTGTSTTVTLKGNTPAAGIPVYAMATDMFNTVAGVGATTKTLGELYAEATDKAAFAATNAANGNAAGFKKVFVKTAATDTFAYSFTLDKTSEDMFVDKTFDVVASVNDATLAAGLVDKVPDALGTAGKLWYEFSSSDDSIVSVTKNATVFNKATVKALKGGSATITVKGMYTGKDDTTNLVVTKEMTAQTITVRVVDPTADEAAKKAAEEEAAKKAAEEAAAKKAAEEAAAKKAAEEAAAKKAAEEEAKKGIPANTTKTVSGTTYKGIDGTSVQVTKTKNAKSVKIGKTVKVDGKTLKVTKIGKKAVTGKKVKNVTIDASNIKKAGNININMFQGAKNLTTVKIKGVKKNSAVYKRIVKAAKKVNKNVKIK